MLFQKVTKTKDRGFIRRRRTTQVHAHDVAINVLCARASGLPASTPLFPAFPRVPYCTTPDSLRASVMPTYYKPSQWRGKRRVFMSRDPDEPKMETMKSIVVILAVTAAMILTAAIIWLSTR